MKETWGNELGKTLNGKRRGKEIQRKKGRSTNKTLRVFEKSQE